MTLSESVAAHREMNSHRGLREVLSSTISRLSPPNITRSTGAALSQNSCSDILPHDPTQIHPLFAPVHLRHAVLVSRRATARADGNAVRPRRQLFTGELFGIDTALDRVIDYFKAAAAGSDVGRRLLLLLGPPSGGKSTLVILLKRGLEEYSHTRRRRALRACRVRRCTSRR